MPTQQMNDLPLPLSFQMLAGKVLQLSLPLEEGFSLRCGQQAGPRHGPCRGGPAVCSVLRVLICSQRAFFQALGLGQPGSFSEAGQ